MKKWLLRGLLVLAVGVNVVAGVSALASPPSDNPGSPGGQCSQGNSGATCVPDPSENGQDCEDHGVAQGNENHCEEVTPSPTPTPSETPTDPPSPSPSVSPSPTPTDVSPSPTPSESSSAPPTEIPSPSETPSSAPPVTGSSGPSGGSQGGKPTQGGGKTQPPSKLAFTGVGDVGLKLLLMLDLLFGAFLLLAWARRVSLADAQMKARGSWVGSNRNHLN